MKLTVPAITKPGHDRPDRDRPGSAESTSLLLEQIDALLAQADSPPLASLAQLGSWPGHRPFTPAA